MFPCSMYTLCLEVQSIYIFLVFSVMPDLELQELAASNHFELNHDKGFFRRNKIPVDFHSNDSGNHSISTNASGET